MSNDNRLAEVQSSHRDADRALDDANGRMTFADEVKSVTERQVKMARITEDLARARGRGWAWGADWETSAADLKVRGDALAREVQKESSAATNRVRSRVDACRQRLTRTAVTAANKAAMQALEEEAEAVKAAVKSEEERLQALAQPFVEPFDALERSLREAHVHLDRFDAAKFQLAPGERPWLTAEAAWQDAPGGAVNGFLYLTDKRVRFEQKETITTKKFLFFTASSEDKHACLIDEPVGNIARSDDSTKGMIFKDQLVTLVWQNTKIQKSTFDINSGGTSKEWDTWIEELRSGQLSHRLAQSAAGPPAPHQGMPVDAPTKCEGCGAGLDAPVRGATTLVCKFCNQRHDLSF